MNAQTYTITEAQRQTLSNFLVNNDRVGFYIALNQMTGSNTALDMAEVSSSSGIRGGTAWVINEAYQGVVPGYPASVEEFSQRVAQGVFDSFTQNPDGTLTVPSDVGMYLAARDTWNAVGEENGNPDLGNDYFPANFMLASYYAEQGDWDTAWEMFHPSQVLADTFRGLWEGIAEVLADSTNQSRTINDFLRDNPDAHYETLTSPSGEEYLVIRDSDGRTIGIVRSTDGPSGPMSFGEQFADGLNNLFGPIINFLNDLGFRIGQNLPTWYDILDTVPDTFNAAQRFLPAIPSASRDPLVLDLDGDGLETVGVNPANAIYFDHDGNGNQTSTGWVKSDDGFLTLDRNGNGVIDNGTELFGDATPLAAGGKAADGFEALAQEDTNADGKVDSLDANWANLRVWRDLNQDGT